MKIAFYRVGNSKNYERHTFDNIYDEPQEIVKMLRELKDEEWLMYDLSGMESELYDFQEDYNDEMLDDGWWSVVIRDYQVNVAELGETIALLTSQVWHKVYDNMREPDCTQLATAIRDAAIRFESEWQARDKDEKDGYYLDEIDRFAEKLTERLIKEFTPAEFENV